MRPYAFLSSCHWRQHNFSLFILARFCLGTLSDQRNLYSEVQHSLIFTHYSHAEPCPAFLCPSWSKRWWHKSSGTLGRKYSKWRTPFSWFEGDTQHQFTLERPLSMHREMQLPIRLLSRLLPISYRLLVLRIWSPQLRPQPVSFICHRLLLRQIPIL